VSLVLNTNVVIDNFNTATLLGADIVHVLTHFHSDHRPGLTSNFRGRLICSSVTSKLVVHQLGVNSSFVEPLEYNLWLPIRGSTEENVNDFEILFADANHCPGSVCVLLRGSGFSYFYSGDFRVNSYVIRNIKSFGLSKFDIGFIDSTFYDQRGMWDVMPSTYNSLDALLNFLKSWSGKLAFEFDMLGTEILLEAVIEHFPHTKVVVTTAKRFQELDIIYSNSSYMMSRLVLGDPDACKSRFIMISRDCPTPQGYTRLRPSTQRWAKLIRSNTTGDSCNFLEHDAERNIVYLFFSTHSCKKEIDTFLETFNIQEVRMLGKSIEVISDEDGPLEAEVATEQRTSVRRFEYSCDSAWLESISSTQETVFQVDQDEVILPLRDCSH
jgi:hypothetical protein